MIILYLHKVYSDQQHKPHPITAMAMMVTNNGGINTIHPFLLPPPGKNNTPTPVALALLNGLAKIIQLPLSEGVTVDAIPIGVLACCCHHHLRMCQLTPWPWTGTKEAHIVLGSSHPRHTSSMTIMMQRVHTRLLPLSLPVTAIAIDAHVTKNNALPCLKWYLIKSSNEVGKRLENWDNYEHYFKCK